MDRRGRALDRARKLAVALQELVEALGRRVPHVERLGEARIAREAAALRHQAAARLEELTASELDLPRREHELSAAVMNDDGAPQLKAGAADGGGTSV